MASGHIPLRTFVKHYRLKKHQSHIHPLTEERDWNLPVEDRAEPASDRSDNADLFHDILWDRNTRIVIDRSSKALCARKDIISWLKFVLVFLAIAGLLIAYVVTERQHDRTLQSLVSSTSNQVSQSSKQLSGLANEMHESLNTIGNMMEEGGQSKRLIKIGMRQDNQLQECKESEFKKSFPDVDYSLLGYNILKGFPLAVGHDPGFTYPIFRANYSSGGQTADCRYSVPQGLVIIPDVSCVTSFSSKIVQTKYEYSEELSASAGVSFGGWGVQFSASAGYKESSSEVSTGESVFIISTASCNYYFSKLITEKPPQFDDVFISWIQKLNDTNANSDIYFDFFDTYGTHFLTEVTFGARYTFQHKMTSEAFESKQESGVNVAVEASYSGLFSVGGGFSLDSSQRESASSFSKSVETKTITVGAAPPANGDAMTWASEVKDSPVPTAYKLSSIESLFTDKYMDGLNVDTDRIRKTITSNKSEYCKFLMDQGQLDSCEELIAGIELSNTLIYGNYRAVKVSSISECIDKCLQEVKCMATTFCLTCTSNMFGYKTCYLFQESGTQTATQFEGTKTVIIQEKIKMQKEILNTTIIGVPRGFENANDEKSSVQKCQELCFNDAYCVAYTHCECPSKTTKCQMFSKERMTGLKVESGTNTFFISGRYYTVTTTTAAPSETNTTASESPTQN
ncbi:uncharacterized protein LOC128550715 [Mercenaria mercenaria]|uniref:uncharacterized protein LOC128550715 n=1 Tax=Mercenaria mercenaria TaxID=6596 RepID=UPI00234EC16A|nr:uncharacterized protein LOC128550715 [Mercenaria mercenaria]XP_053386288.1 uncharacterized protein LOC128550715 [Mercenaria mercenaria]